LFLGAVPGSDTFYKETTSK